MFVALDLPAQARAELAAWRDTLISGRDDLRPVAPEALHVTLVFLGWQDEAAARRVAPLPDGPAPPTEPFPAAALTLYRSTLRPQGALYEPLARLELA
jgi:2'-5' RNA ligase